MALILAVQTSVAACTGGGARKTDALPEMYPDYVGVTIPVNIAPLNFMVEDAEAVELMAETDGRSYRFRNHGPVISFPRRQWRQMLQAEAGNSLTVTVRAKSGGEWSEYQPFTWTVSPDTTDRYLVYRRLDPGYEFYARMGIYQRDLESFSEKTVYENSAGRGCLNCHSFRMGDPDFMQMHFRVSNGGTLVRKEGEDHMFNMSNDLTLGATYPYWHPSGKYVAYSVNEIKQSFHNIPDKVLEVYDFRSDVVVFDIDRKEISVIPALQRPDKFETFPAFSPDGETLYFCRAEARGPEEYDKVRYGLFAIPFDGDTTITELYAPDDGSTSFPRPSYDGRYLMFVQSDYGNFSIWHKEADLYMMDLADGSVRCLDEINSPDTESYHSWSTTSRWVVFSSRREDGLHTRLYLSHLGADGRFSKPFLLPQKDPRSNGFLLQSYNVPEFVTGKVRIGKDKVTSKERETITACYR